MPERAFTRLLIRVAIAAVVCTLLAVSFAGAAYADYKYRDYDVTWAELLVRALADWWPWVVLAPLIVLLAERFRFEPRRWPVAMMVHLPAAVIFSVGKTAIKASVLDQIFGADRIRGGVGELARGALLYLAFVAAVHGLESQRRYRERALRTSQLESQLAQSRLQALRMQLHPHFLFNTLHAIATLMHRDVNAAEQMLTRLSELLRLTLEEEGADRVSLDRELDILRRYLAIEEVRFGDRLEVVIDAADDCRDALVPNLLLQPLAENAVRHGISARAGTGRITVRARREGDTLVLDVSDDGPGFPDTTDRTGVGLANTHARLGQLYGRAAHVAIENPPDGGARVRIAIPFEREEAT